MEFRVLGAIEVVADDGRCLAIGGSRSRALLAALLLRHGNAICRDTLIDSLWADPPASASHAVEVYASRLRSAVGKSRICSQGHAYRVEIQPVELDLGRFRALAKAGRDAVAAGAVEVAARYLEDALGCWRGDPVACLNGEPLAAEARGSLEEERRGVIEAFVDARLALGLHEELLPELSALVAAYPTRERLWARLMLALYRSGRQVEALEAFRRLRTRLLDELGIEPGPELRELERGILTHDASLSGFRAPGVGLTGNLGAAR